MRNDAEKEGGSEGMPPSDTSQVIHWESKTILITGDIHEDLSRTISAAMPMLDQTKGPITVKVNSFGGYVHCGLSIASELLRLENPVIVDVTGVAYSAASDIVLAGDIVRMSELGLLMFHSPSWALDDRLENHKLESSVMEAHYRGVMKKLLKRSKVDLKDFFEKTNGKDYYLFPAQALKMGIVDEVY